jgi:hypothetical protein
VSGDTITIAVTLTGHKNQRNGIPATGRRVQLPVCFIFSFDEIERLTGSRSMCFLADCIVGTNPLTALIWLVAEPLLEFASFVREIPPLPTSATGPSQRST